ncbi:MAG: pseudouridine synthase [Crocinitomicaceae bacterium]
MKVIYEDNDLIAVNKPPNLIVHHSHYARNIKEISLVQQLREYTSASIFPVHRLDRKTSGLLIFAKDKVTAKHLQDQFEAQTVEKTYLALVRGFVTTSGKVDTPVKNEESGKYSPALTFYEPIEQLEVNIPVPPYSTARYSLIALFPKTGKMHQLRKHMNKISHPIIGDPKYGNRHHNQMFQERLHHAELFLHACSIRFIHPSTNIIVNFTVPPPEKWKNTLHSLGFSTDLEHFLITIKDGRNF